MRAGAAAGNEDGMRYVKEIVTPELAKKWIDSKYHGQRLVKPMLVEYLCKKILAGTWDGDHPQAISISEENELIDGQHRCLAIIKSNRSVSCYVAYGVPSRVYPAIDDGISRTLYDRVSFIPENPTHNKSAASVVTSWWFLNHNKHGRATPEEAISLFKKHESAIRWVVAAKTHTKGLGRVQCALALAQMYERNPNKARDLAKTVWDGDQKLPNGIRMREFLLSFSKTAPRGIDERGASIAQYIYETCVCFCKSELAGKEVKRLRTDSWKNQDAL